MNNMDIQYKVGCTPTTAEIISLYADAGLNRPISDPDRIKKMYDYANLIVTAWDGDQLIGIARALTDFCYCCYLSDLAVKSSYQKKGIGRKLIAITKEEIGEQSMLLLLSAPNAIDYYSHIGMEHVKNGYIINRER